MLQKLKNQILQNIIPYIMKNSLVVCMEKVYSHLSKKDKIMPIQLEAGQI
jgi:hypothetical protein